jgi:hypothetical protein
VGARQAWRDKDSFFCLRVNIIVIAFKFSTFFSDLAQTYILCSGNS